MCSIFCYSAWERLDYFHVYRSISLERFSTKSNIQALKQMEAKSMFFLRKSFDSGLASVRLYATNLILCVVVSFTLHLYSVVKTLIYQAICSTKFEMHDMYEKEKHCANCVHRINSRNSNNKMCNKTCAKKSIWIVFQTIFHLVWHIHMRKCLKTKKLLSLL